MIFGFFGKKKKQEREREIARLRQEMESEREGLVTELELLEKKLNVELGSDETDRSTTLSRYPKRIVELRIQIDAIDRKLKQLDDSQ